MKQITLCFAGVMLMVMCVLIMTQLPTRSMVITYVGPDRPYLDLPVADAARKVRYKKGMAEISLNRKGRWVASGWPIEEVANLETFLSQCAELMREHDRSPGLRMRIARDAPARFMRDAVMLAEDLGYAEVLLAVYREER